MTEGTPDIDVDYLCGTAREAGRAIMEVYSSEFAVEYKSDNSPLTLADKRSSALIEAALLKMYPDIPVISEEGEPVPYETRRGWRRFWLVDPLDGTKEFVKRGGDFTVNIALVDDGRPVIGVIYAPVPDLIYYALKGWGAWKEDHDFPQGMIHTKKKPEGEGFTVVHSRSHPSKKLEDFLATVPVKTRLLAGSSLKFCMVAEGTADFYPRLGPTSEWDTAAGQCIVEEAGGSVLDLNGAPLGYNKPDLLNEGFMVYG